MTLTTSWATLLGSNGATFLVRMLNSSNLSANEWIFLARITGLAAFSQTSPPLSHTTPWIGLSVQGGLLAFLITGTVFKNESSQGFRRWTLHHENGTSENMSVELVEDYKAIRPFEGVANWPSLLIIKRNGENTAYPVTYREYRKPQGKPVDGELLSMPIQKQAIPIPGTIDGPWLVGSNGQLSAWSQIMDATSSDKSYSARKGVTTDANGIYFVSTHATNVPDVVRISNDPRNGRRSLPRITADVESSYIYPLLRGREISRFNATPSPGSCVIVPQTGMFGDDKLPATSPQLFHPLQKCS